MVKLPIIFFNNPKTVKNQTIEGVSPHAEKNIEFQEAEAAGIRLGLLENLKTIAPESIVKLKALVENLPLSSDTDPLLLAALRVYNFRPIAEITNLNEEQLNTLHAFLESLCVSKRLKGTSVSLYESSKKTTDTRPRLMENPYTEAIRKWLRDALKS